MKSFRLRNIHLIIHLLHILVKKIKVNGKMMIMTETENSIS